MFLIDSTFVLFHILTDKLTFEFYVYLTAKSHSTITNEFQLEELLNLFNDFKESQSALNQELRNKITDLEHLTSGKLKCI